ncbi:hypothetical protein CGCSCA4_v004078 [Colletotrichum siamense]|uniref:Uncharacterized protein n=1 Tax=Colletotrichum siamense TaxID=690259 RepID=A0A9P5K9J1_COLSI|nr:hypothetical protein CGCSCA4_v004078 [Colletotrichum siamense]KAF4863493.1 hypothetical protein CGCSCA2_v003064 [Colletotrichum siamense]
MGFPLSSSPATRQMRFIAPVSPLSSSPATHGTHCAQKRLLVCPFNFTHPLSKILTPRKAR